MLNEKCLKEIQNLKSHIIKGCLSGIPSGMGTNRNEALHKNINPYFSQSRLSVHMAYALLSLLFHCHNEHASKRLHLSTVDDTGSAYNDPTTSPDVNHAISHDHTYFFTEHNFLSSSVLGEEVEKFRGTGFFDSELGNTTVLALANFLETTIIVVSTIKE